jgi:hypothetical protein
MTESTKDQAKPIIKLKAKIDLNEEFPTRKLNFHKFADLLRKKGYTVKETVIDVMCGSGRFEISFQYDSKGGKILTNIDPYSKMAILDSDVELHTNELIKLIEDYINANK